MEVRILRHKGLKYSPDLVIVQYHQNDVQNVSRINELYKIYRKNLSRETNLPEQRIEALANKNAYLAEKKEREYKDIEVLMEPVRKSLGKLKDLGGKHNFSVLVVGRPVPSRQSSHLRDISENLSIHYVDMTQRISEEYSGFNQPLDRNKYKFRDGHPNSKGHKIIAEELETYLKNSSLLR